jgi:hypothetical protein
METIYFTLKVAGFSVLILFGVVNIVYLITPRRSKPYTAEPCDCDETEPFSPKALEKTLILALRSYNIKHNTEYLAKEVLKENPGTDDLDQLINLALHKIRQKYA